VHKKLKENKELIPETAGIINRDTPKTEAVFLNL